MRVSSDKNPAIVGERILVQFKIDEKGEDFKSPSFDGLRILSGPNPSTSSSYTFINGKSESKTTTTYSFYLKAIQEGSFNIGSASVQINNKTIKSQPYQLKVVKKSKANKEKQKTLEKNLFIKVEIRFGY